MRPSRLYIFFVFAYICGSLAITSYERLLGVALGEGGLTPELRDMAMNNMGVALAQVMWVAGLLIRS